MPRVSKKKREEVAHTAVLRLTNYLVGLIRQESVT